MPGCQKGLFWCRVSCDKSSVWRSGVVSRYGNRSYITMGLRSAVMLSQSPECSVRPLSLGRAPLVGRGLCSSLLVLLALGAVQAGAATINANGTTCSLANAIRAANRVAQVAPQNSCTAGTTGSDTIELLYDVDISVAASSTAGLPDVSSVIVLNGNQHIIQRTGSNNFRLMNIAINGNLTLNDVTLKNGKEPTLDGGAILNVGTLNVKNSVFDSNQCTLEGCRGGAIRSQNSLTIDNSIFINNNSNGSYGGAIYNTLNVPNITRSAFSNNTSNGSLGGAIYNDGGSMVISSSTFNANSGPQGGGAIASSSGVLSVDNCTFNSNTSSLNGGALSGFGNATLTLFLNTFINNSANNGGAISLETATTNGVTMWGNLISGNSATIDGSNIYNDGTVTIDNSYNLLGDSGSTYAQSLFGYTLASNDINANQTKPDGSLNPASTALTSILNTTLDYNGGPTKTHALVLGSPAIDAVDSNLCFPADLDQRGFYRANGNANDVTNTPYTGYPSGNTTPPQSGYGNTNCDMGAYEFAAKPTKKGAITYTSSRISGPTIIGTGPRYSIEYRIRSTNVSSGSLRNVVYKLNTVCFLNKSTNPYTCLSGTDGFLVDDGGTSHGPGWAVSIPDSTFTGNTFDNSEVFDTTIKLSISGKSGTLRYIVDFYADPAARETLAVSDHQPQFLESMTFDVDLDEPAAIPKRTLASQESTTSSEISHESSDDLVRAYK